MRRKQFARQGVFVVGENGSDWITKGIIKRTDGYWGQQVLVTIVESKTRPYNVGQSYWMNLTNLSPYQHPSDDNCNSETDVSILFGMAVCS